MRWKWDVLNFKFSANGFKKANGRHPLPLPQHGGSTVVNLVLFGNSLVSSLVSEALVRRFGVLSFCCSSPELFCCIFSCALKKENSDLLVWTSFALAATCTCLFSNVSYVSMWWISQKQTKCCFSSFPCWSLRLFSIPHDWKCLK